MPYLNSGYMIGSRSICRHGLFPFESCFGLWQGVLWRRRKRQGAASACLLAGACEQMQARLAGILQGNDAP